jgi:hypothetical protein
LLRAVSQVAASQVGVSQVGVSQVGVSQVVSAGWAAPATWVPLAAGAALLACYAAWAARRDQPAWSWSRSR